MGRECLTSNFILQIFTPVRSYYKMDETSSLFFKLSNLKIHPKINFNIYINIKISIHNIIIPNWRNIYGSR